MNKLKEIPCGEPIVVNKYENSCTESMLDNDDNLPRIKSSFRGSKCIGSVSTPHKWKHRKYIKEGFSDNVYLFQYSSNNSNSIRMVCKVRSINDVENKILGMRHCEDNIPKYTTIFYRQQIKSALRLTRKSKLMSENGKMNYLLASLAE